ncbi:hypothetical protein Pfo_029328 [Paulownia fortunei]|nr:hypothetical protein Pfo_029328 [Paulownia fortunei]
MGSESSAQYIHMVQHLIEECIIFNMSKEECMELSQNMQISSQKRTRSFLRPTRRREERRSSAETETSQRIPNILLDSSRKIAMMMMNDHCYIYY